MFILRLAALLVVAGVAVLLLAFLLTRDRRYLRYALRLFKWTVALLLLLLLLFALEHVATMI